MVETRILPLLTWRRQVAESDLPSTTKLVAFALSLWMNERGASAYPGADTLAKDTSLSVRAVRDHLAEMVRLGWLELVEKGGLRGQRRKANVYCAAVPPTPLPLADGGTSCTRAADAPVQQTTPTPAPDDIDGGTSFTPSLQDLSMNSPTDGQAKPGPFVDEFDSWWKSYPKKDKRRAALDAFRARRRAGVTLERLIDARDRYLQAKEGTETRYLMHGATFLAAKDGPWSEWEQHKPPSLEALAEPAAPKPAPRACPLELCRGTFYVDVNRGGKKVSVPCRCRTMKASA